MRTSKRLDLTIKLHPIFEGCRVYGPYWNRFDRRYGIYIIYPNGSKLSMWYAKFVWVNHYGIWPAKGYEIDHKNDNKIDDTIENLQCILAKNNRAKSSAGNKTKYGHFVCPWCEVDFIREAVFTHINPDRPVTRNIWTACSISCATKIKFAYKGYANVEFEGNVKRIFYTNPTGLKDYIDGTR